MDIDKVIADCLKDNVFGEDSVVEARTILTWMDKGKREAEKVSKIVVDNLTKGGFVKNDKLVADKESLKDENTTIWFCLLIAGAKGLLECR